jgi:diguanylate cyclase (GGDEF)-like protein
VFYNSEALFMVLRRQVAQELQTLLRHSDILARFGGDEFAIALPETTPAQAEAVAEKLRTVHIPADPSIEPVTLSVGMSRLEPDRETPEQLLEAADRSLYAWKERVKAARHPVSSSRIRP